MLLVSGWAFKEKGKALARGVYKILHESFVFMTGAILEGSTIQVKLIPTVIICQHSCEV